MKMKLTKISKAKRAALLVCASVMERKHAMEREAESLRKKLEKIQIEMESEASDAELTVLKTYSDQDRRTKGRVLLRFYGSGKSSLPLCLT